MQGRRSKNPLAARPDFSVHCMPGMDRATVQLGDETMDARIATPGIAPPHLARPTYAVKSDCGRTALLRLTSML